LLLLILLPTAPAFADEQGRPEILGRCGTEDLLAKPFDEWFVAERDSYQPAAETLDRLRGVGFDGIELSIFFGTWCGDSRREVPRVLRLLDEMNFPAERVILIGVDGDAEMHKRSPGGEEQGLEIYRVPTVIVRRDGREWNRIVEYPVLSLERDLLAILGGNEYAPSYRSYPIVRDWLADGSLADPNVSPRGLADAVRQVVSGEGELAAAARVMLTRGEVTEAVKLYEVNVALFRENARSWARLAKARVHAGDSEGALVAAKRAMRLNDDPDEVEGLIDLVQSAAP
jgi:hypothetical protein